MSAYSQFLARHGYTGKYKGKSPHSKPVLKTESNAPLSNSIPGNGVKRQANTYTGDELVGIATMHKSNAVPVRKDNIQAAKDISAMRR